MYLNKLKNNDLQFTPTLQADDGSYIFYIIHNREKILKKYTPHRFLRISPDYIDSKLVEIQCFYTLDGKTVKESIKNFLFKRVMYTRGYVSNNFKELKTNGYKSYDKKTLIDISKIDWNYTKDHNFNFNIHSLRFLSSYWGEYFSTYNYNYILEALEVFRGYWEAVERDKLVKFKKYDMSLGIRALHIYFLSNFKEYLTKEQIELYNKLYKFHYEELRFNVPISKNNHGIWQIFGLRMLVLANNDKNVDDVAFCNTELTRLLDFSFNDEGIHVENSPMYHNYVVNLFAILPKQLFPNVNKFSTIVKSKDVVVAWLCDTNGSYYQIGDSHGQYNVGLKDFRKVLNWDVVVNKAEFYSKSYLDSGYFIARDIVKDNFNAFVLSCTSNTLVHKHLDNSSFILWHNNIELITDSGPYAYEYSTKREYFVSEKAHNVLSLRGHNFTIKDIVTSESGILSSEAIHEGYKTISFSSFREFSYKREITYKPFKKVIINDFIVSNARNLDLTFNLTFGLDIDLIKIDENIFLQHNGLNVAKIYSKTPFLEVNIFKGDTEPMRGWISKKYNVMEETYSLEFLYDRALKEILVEITLL